MIVFSFFFFFLGSTYLAGSYVFPQDGLLVHKAYSSNYLNFLQLLPFTTAAVHTERVKAFYQLKPVIKTQSHEGRDPVTWTMLQVQRRALLHRVHALRGWKARIAGGEAAAWSGVVGELPLCCRYADHYVAQSSLLLTTVPPRKVRASCNHLKFLRCILFRALK